MVKRRQAHIGLGGQLIDAQRFGVLALNPLKHAANLAEVSLAAHQRHQRAAARPGEHVVEHFADNLLAENTGIQRAFHHVQQTFGGAKDLFGQRRRVNPAFRHRRAEKRVFTDIHEQFLELENIDVETQSGQRGLSGGKSFTFEG